MFKQKAAVLCQVMQIVKNIFDYDVIMTSRNPYDTHHRVVIHHARFDVCTSSSFRKVKTDRQTELCFVHRIHVSFICFTKRICFVKNAIYIKVV